MITKESAYEKNIKVLAFIHSNPDEIPLGKSEKDGELRLKLKTFKENVSTKRLVKFWSRADELPGLVSLSISKTIKTYPAIGWIRANTSADPQLYKEMNELRKENQELRQVNDDLIGLDISLQSDILADMQSLIKVTGKDKEWDRYAKKDIITDWNISISWNQIFALLSPYLLHPPNDESAKAILSKVIYDILPDAEKKGTATIYDQDYQTIKIQLKALGLTDIKYSKTVSGGMGLFWYLTEKGEKLMLQLRSVKK